jgi:23S rRNA pseudouridine1911/1915/1917 synthase
VNIPVIYEDKWLLAVDKPSGLVTIPTPKEEKRTLTSVLNEEFANRGSGCHLHPGHRLDRETSGLILYAKGKSMQQKIMQLFKEKKITKTYIAFVQGSMRHRQGWIKTPIDGRSALTRYSLVAAKNHFSVVEVFPLTGRTNQIRLHFKSIGHPLVGETRFVFRRDFCLRAKRLFLHAKQLEFKHPVTNRAICIHADLPKDMRDFLLNNG